MLIELSEQNILNDIRAYEERKLKAQDTLQKLPAGHLPYPEYKKREKLKREYQEEINHVNYLISLAKEGLNEIY